MRNNGIRNREDMDGVFVTQQPLPEAKNSSLLAIKSSTLQVISFKRKRGVERNRVLFLGVKIRRD
jgi:hypothetical protein